MRYLQYPQSCSARTIVEFGNTGVGFGGGDVTVADMDKFLKDTVKKMRTEKNTFCTCLLNNDQDQLFRQTLLDNGFALVQSNMYHPKYGKSVSFYLLTLDWGINHGFPILDRTPGQPVAIPGKETVAPAKAA